MRCGERVRCRHCRRARINHGRGLCWDCRAKPGVKDLYPSKRARPSGAPALYESSRPALKVPVPTTAGPGTAQKLAVLIARAEAGEYLWHPDDAREIGAATVPLDLLAEARRKTG